MKTTDSTPTPNPPTPKAFINALNKGKIKMKQKKKKRRRRRKPTKTTKAFFNAFNKEKIKKKQKKPTKTTKAFLNASTHNQKQQTKKQHNTNTPKTNQTHKQKTSTNHFSSPNNTKPNIVPYKTNHTTKLKTKHPIQTHIISKQNFYITYNKIKTKPNTLTKARPTGLALIQEKNNKSRNTNKYTPNKKGNITSKEYTSYSIKTKTQTSYPKIYLTHTISLHKHYKNHNTKQPHKQKANNITPPITHQKTPLKNKIIIIITITIKINNIHQTRPTGLPQSLGKNTLKFRCTNKHTPDRRNNTKEKVTHTIVSTKQSFYFKPYYTYPIRPSIHPKNKKTKHSNKTLITNIPTIKPTQANLTKLIGARPTGLAHKKEIKNPIIKYHKNKKTTLIPHYLS